MWLRRAFYGWLIPAAFLLPLWLLVGWVAFDASGWALLWVLFVAVPSVFLGQLGLTLLVRARREARARRAVSWWDVAGFTLWHSLTIALGFFAAAWWLPVMVLTVAAGLGMFWLEVWQLWRSLQQTGAALLQTTSGMSYLQPAADDEVRDRARQHRDVIVVPENGGGLSPGYPHPGNGR